VIAGHAGADIGKKDRWTLTVYRSSVASTYGLIHIIPNGTTIEIISSVRVQGRKDL
jgi:hypothetical protein